MARGNYGPEVKAAIGEKKPSTKKGPPTRSKAPPPRGNDPGDTPADMARDKRMGIAEDSARDQAIDARNVPGQHAPPPQSASLHASPPHPPSPGGANPAHAAMAASIAHAILGGGRGGGY